MQTTRTRGAQSLLGPLLAAGLALALVACESAEDSLMPPTPRIPKPITGGPGFDSARVSGALEAGGGQMVTPAGQDDALTRDVIFSGPPLPPVTGSAGVLPPTGGRGVSLNFANASVVDVVDAIVAESLGLNYVIDPTVTGQVTMRTTEPIPQSALLSVLENILAVNNAAMIVGADTITVVPAEAAGRLSGVAGGIRRDQTRGSALYIIPLEHASAESVRNVAQSVLSPGREILVEPELNYLMFSGTSREAQAVQDLVDVLDVNQLAGRSFGLFPLEASGPENVVDELEAIFGIQSEDGAIEFLPITRMNAILAIARDTSYLRQAQTWVHQLDRGQGATGSGAKVYVYHVRNGRATELAEMLRAMFTGIEPRREAEAPGVAPTLEPVSLSRVVAPVEQELAPGTVPLEEPRPAADIVAAPALSGPGPDAAPPDLGADTGIPRFIADTRNNAVVIVATPQQYDLIEATLERLDIVPLQVLIEVTIAEVSLDNSLRYGLQWFFENGDFSTSLTNFSTGIPRAVFPGFNAVFDDGSARAVLSALAEVTDVKVISSPQLMVLDNQVARLHIGDQVPVATQSAVSVTDPDAPIVNNIQLVDTGVILEVTPRVNASGLVTLEVLQDVSDAVETVTSTIDSPTIQQRTIQTTVAVASGSTVALGGLIRDRAEDGESGIPGLKDVPVVGNLFKTTRRNARRTELLILITPHVIRDTVEAELVARELQDRLTGLRELRPADY
ncbi:MAG TPA: type II secretion system secretin GspD [Thermohalobaculum sp.]|nr:type II secretion system secretin GspD [Thermohalobaculum sp.]